MEKKKLIKFLKSIRISKKEIDKMPNREACKSQGFNEAIKQFNNYIDSDEFDNEIYDT
ncbi:hypothetical protein RPMD05_27 [Rhodobacteraceae phage LS06-2018-MD05]|nr:hypothetical protein RPMD05_27 [Rhodobacteraceae phage LS06-2018-MD05]